LAAAGVRAPAHGPKLGHGVVTGCAGPRITILFDEARGIELAPRAHRLQEIEAMSESKQTTDHDEIRKWVEERGGQPAHVKTTAKGKDVGLLRISFPGYDDENDENLETIEWDEFFRKFDESKLSFLYQDRTADGELSTFNKFIHR